MDAVAVTIVVAYNEVNDKLAVLIVSVDIVLDALMLETVRLDMATTDPNMVDAVKLDAVLFVPNVVDICNVEPSNVLTVNVDNTPFIPMSVEPFSVELIVMVLAVILLAVMVFPAIVEKKI